MSPTPTTSRRPQSSPARSSWTRRRSSPTKSLLRTPTTLTPRSKTCSHEAHRAHACHSLREDLSVSLSWSSMFDRTARPVEQRNQEAQIRTLLDKQKEQILAECQARINRHEFQAAYDRRSLLKLGEIVDSQQEEISSRSSRRSSTTRSTACPRTIIASKFGNTRSSSEKSH